MAAEFRRRNEMLNRVYANVLGKPVLVPESDLTSLGSAIFAFLAAGTFKTVEEAQDAMCPKYRVVEPESTQARTASTVYGCFRKAYFAIGSRNAEPANLGEILPLLRTVASEVRKANHVGERCANRFLKRISNWSIADWFCTRSEMPAPSRARTALW